MSIRMMIYKPDVNNAIHQSTSEIVGQYGFVAMEDLNVKGMLKNHCLAGALSDAAFGEFKGQVQYKLNWNGGELALVDRWFPSSKLCSVCGCINDSLTLAEREWACLDCGTHHNRDENAAKNILAKALQTPGGLDGTARGGLEAVSSPAKREESDANKSLIRGMTRAQICQYQFGIV